MIEYKKNDRIKIRELDGFFRGWKAPPSAGAKNRLLKGSDLVIAARDKGRLVGFLTAISDGIMHCFITLVEVLDSYQGRGIGRRLLEIAVSHYAGFYQIAVITDPDKVGFYKNAGFRDICGAFVQNFNYEEDR